VTVILAAYTLVGNAALPTSTASIIAMLNKAENLREINVFADIRDLFKKRNRFKNILFSQGRISKAGAIGGHHWSTLLSRGCFQAV
jgi:hypothetical protein